MAQATTDPSSVSDRFPPPPPETPKGRTTRFVGLFVMAFLMVTMMYATYMGTMHDPQPRDLPVAVVGDDPAARALVKDLTDSTDGALEVRSVADADEGRELLLDQEVTAVLVPPVAGDPTAVVRLASASGMSATSLVQTLVTPTLVERGWQVEVDDVAPLPEGDGTGTLALFAAMGLVLAGYVPLSGMLNGTPNLLRIRKFLPLSVAWGAVTSSLVWTVLGPVVGAVEGHYLLFLGVGTLTVTAVAVAQLLMTRLIGPLAVLLGMFLMVVLGVPASNLGFSIHQMPAYFGWLHGVLPLPAAGEALRSALYFDGRGLGGHLLVLALWAVVALALVVLKERRSGYMVVGGPAHTDPEAPLAALAGGPVAGYRKRLFAAAAFPLSIVLAVVALMGFSMHKAQVTDMPVAVVGPAQVAQPVVDGLAAQLGDTVELTVVDDVDALRERLLDQELVAGYVLPSTPDGQPELVVATGTGKAQAQAVTQIFTHVATASGATLEVTDLVPLDGDDTNGSNAMYAAMAWVMSGFLLWSMLRGGAPDVTRTRDHLKTITGWSIGMAVWLWFLFDVLIGALNGHALAMIGLGALTIFAVSWASAVLIRMFGLGTLVVVMVAVMLAGVPVSGGGLSLYMVPEVLRPLADFQPLAVATDAVRSLFYLDGRGVGGDVLVLAVWGAVGLAVNFLVVDPWVNRASARPHAPMGPIHVPSKHVEVDSESEELVSA